MTESTTTTENLTPKAGVNISTPSAGVHEADILSDGWALTAPTTVTYKERNRIKNLKTVMTYIRQRKWDKIDRPLLDKAGLQSIPKIRRIDNVEGMREIIALVRNNRADEITREMLDKAGLSGIPKIM